MARPTPYHRTTFPGAFRESHQEPGYSGNRQKIVAPQYPESPKTPGAGQRIAMVGTLADTILGFRGELIRDMVRAGHQVYAFATDYTPETERAILAMGAMPVRYSMGRLSTNPVRDLVSMWQLYRLFRSYNITCSFA